MTITKLTDSNRNFTFSYNGKEYTVELKKSKFASNYSPIRVSDNMTGKMEGIPSISTSCLVNPICIKRMQNGESVCHYCFAEATLSRYKAAGKNAEMNFYLLNSQVLDLDLLPRFRNVAIGRIESFGDVASVTQAINYLNIARVNPRVRFGAWTKNAYFWSEAVKLVGKPENISNVFSSSKLNKEAAAAEYIDKETGVNYFDHVFTVYEKEIILANGGIDSFINCGARDCASCQRCYYKDTDFSVREMLK